MMPDEVGGHVADVEMDVIEPVALDLGIDRARDDIARRQLHPDGIIIGHETLAGGRVDQPSAFAAHRLGDQEVLDLQIVEAGRVELHHLHVRHARARAPSHRDAVARRAAWRGREQVSAARTPGREDRRARRVERDASGAAVDRIDAPDPACARIAHLVPPGGEVDRDLVGDQRDVGVRFGGSLQRLLHRPAGRVGDMDDPAMTVAALARQVQRVPFGLERHAEMRESFDRGRRALDHHLDDPAIVQSGAGDHRVLDMILERVAGFEYRGDPALRPSGRPFVERPLGEHGDGETVGEGERGGQPGRAGTDDENVAGHAARDPGQGTG
jgi:hypothetical protein